MQQLIQQLSRVTPSSVHNPSEAGRRGRRLTLSSTVYSAPVFEPAPHSPVDRGATMQALALTAVFSFFGIVLMSVAFYQWNLIQQQHVDIERVRADSASRVSALRKTAMPGAASLAGPGAYAGTTREVASRRELSEYVSQVKPLVLMWREAMLRVENADSAAISGALATLREVESRAASVVPPSEAQGVHDRLLAAMCGVRQRYEAATGESVEPAQPDAVDEARKSFDSAAAVFEAMQRAT